jgi:hypothetical protein
MTQEITSTKEKSGGLTGIMDTLQNSVCLVIDEIKFRNRKRVELKGIIIDEGNAKYEDEVCDFLARKLSERDSNPYNLGKWFSDKCVPQFYDATTQLPFNYISKKDPRNEFRKNEYNLEILRYRVWEKLYDRVLILHRADIIDIRRRFFDSLIDSR